jgi:hypothetical protein
VEGGRLAAAGVVQLSEPMRRFQCNQKGCCCSGWEIAFGVEDFVRLHDHLGPEDRAALTRGVQVVLEQKTEGAEPVLRAVKLEGMGEGDGCRFLAADGGCGVHRRYGTDALPDLCVDFPAFGYRQDDGRVELWFDPVCPEVLERLDESDEPLRLFRQPGFFGDPGFDLRVSHSADLLRGRLGAFKLEADLLDRIRAASVDAFADPKRPVWRALAALSHAFGRLEVGASAGFEVVEPADTGPFLRFLERCIGAHGAELLSSIVVGASDCIVQLYGTSLRFAAAMGAVLQRPVDRNLYKAAIGAAEFFHRTLEMPREALPWFAAAQPSAV